jgi:CheY-like chemotaxis protein
VHDPNTPASKCIIGIVEDDESFRRALGRLLCASGFEAHTFASAEEFLESAMPESHACLILDIQLPGMSGFELFDHLIASGRPRPAFFHHRAGRGQGPEASVPDSTIAYTYASQWSAPCCWTPCGRCSAAAVLVERAPEHDGHDPKLPVGPIAEYNSST